MTKSGLRLWESDARYPYGETKSVINAREVNVVSRGMRYLFEALNEHDRREFVQSARRRAFRAGDKVFWQGDPADAVHVVVKGSFAASVSTPTSQTVIVAVFRRDEAFGELALLGVDAVAWHATVRGVAPTFAAHRSADHPRPRAPTTGDDRSDAGVPLPTDRHAPGSADPDSP